MTRTVTLNLPADLDAVLVEKATGNDTPESLAARIVDEWCAPYAAQKAANARAALIPIADALLSTDAATRDEVIDFAKTKLGLS